MSIENGEKLSTQPYRGSRDFYPAEMRSRDYIFEKLSKTVEAFGFEKVDAPLIEPLDIYLAKTSEEIVSQQLYSFTDRGGRKVAIRPEMTPTVSRMVAQRFRELPKPIRWYCLPNLWRYERPGKGRLREHWQLNCDIFAADNEDEADLEIIQLAIELLRAFGARATDFKVHISHRRVLNALFERILELKPGSFAPVARAMDKRAKVSSDVFATMLKEEGLSGKQVQILSDYLDRGIAFLNENKDALQEGAVESILRMVHILKELGYEEYVEFDSSIVRGFDYYTGLVFEVYDTNPENRRSLFGGGRYDNLVSTFSKESANAVGFGMGDVTLVDFLKVHDLFYEPALKNDVYLINLAGEEAYLLASRVCQVIRSAGLNIETSLSNGKLKKQMKTASMRSAQFVILIGETELKENKVTVKNMKTHDQTAIDFDQVGAFFKGMHES